MMNRCGFCGGIIDGELVVDNFFEVYVGEVNGSFKLQDESCFVDVMIDMKKFDGFGMENGWFGCFLGFFGE